jgi:hypothetical protein
MASRCQELFLEISRHKVDLWVQPQNLILGALMNAIHAFVCSAVERTMSMSSVGMIMFFI